MEFKRKAIAPENCTYWKL